MFTDRKSLAVAVLAALSCIKAHVMIHPYGHSDLCLGADTLDNGTLFIANCFIPVGRPGVVWSYLPRTDSAGPLVLDLTESGPENSLAVLANHNGGTYTPAVSISIAGTVSLRLATLTDQMGRWNGSDATDQSRWL